MGLEVAQLGRYKIISPLGAGGMGEVYLAEDVRLHRRVALKLIHTTEAADPEAKRRFLREAHAAAQLEHPGICTVYEIGSDGERDYLAMQYVDGETLDIILAQRRPSLADALRIAVDAADALACAHAHGIVHRDVKPQNIMINREGQVKLMDFGLARPDRLDAGLSTSTQEALTRTGTFLGTVQYMSPEQLHGRAADARSDIFSFGLVLCELFTGRHPFQAPTAAATLSAILTKKADPLPASPKGPMRQVEAILSRTLEKDPSKRYQSIDDLRADLMRVKAVVDKKNAAHERRMFRRNVIVIAASIILIGAAILAGMSWHRTPAPSKTTSVVAVPAEHTFTYGLMTLSAEGQPQFVNPTQPFYSGERFRAVVQTNVPGFLYLLDDSKPQSGTGTLSLIYPTTDRPSITATAGSTESGWLVLDNHPGIETLWIVWSEKAVPELEPILRLANAQDMGVVRDTKQAEEIRTFLTSRAGKVAQLGFEPGANKFMIRSSDRLLVRSISIDHRARISR